MRRISLKRVTAGLMAAAICMPHMAYAEGEAIIEPPSVETMAAEETAELMAETEELVVAYKENFEKMISIANYKPSAMDLKADENTIDIVKEANGNQYLYIERKKSDPLVDIYMPIKDRPYVIEMDFWSTDTSGPDKSLGTGEYKVLINKNAEVRLSDQTKIGTVKRTGFTNIAFAINPIDKTYCVYIDRKLATGVISCTDSVADKQFRFYCYNGNGSNSMRIDNIAIYSGTQLIDVNQYGGFGNEMLATTEAAKAQAGSNAVAMHAMSNRILLNGEREELDTRPIWKDEAYYVPSSIVQKAFGLDVTSLCDKKSVVAGNTVVKGTKIDGVVYAEIGDLCNRVLHTNYFVDREGYGYDKGFAIIGNGDYTAFENDFSLYSELNNYLCYERPTADEVLALFESCGTKAHPRLLMHQEDFDALKKDLKTNSEKQAWVDQTVKEADAILNYSTPTLDLEGPRLNSLHGLVGRAYTLCMAYKLTGKSKYAEKLYTDLKVMGDRTNWNPSHFLDVGAGTTAYALAYDWLYDYWSTERKTYLEETMLKQSLIYYYNSLHQNEYTNWIKETVEEGKPGNWPIVCTSGPMMAAIAMMDVYPAHCSAVVSDGLRVLEYTLKGFADHGDWPEGLLYWAYAQQYYANLIESMETGLGTDLGYFYDVPGMKETVDYYIALIGKNGGFNFGDSATDEPDLRTLSWHASQWLSRDREHAYDLFRFVHMYHQKENMSASMWDILKMDNQNAKTEPKNLACEYYSDKMGIGIVRSDWNSADGTYLGYVRGSKMRMSHGHADHGSFVFDTLGTRWICDLGSDEYNINDYYTNAYRVRAEAHNVYVINPDAGVGQLTDRYGNKNIRKEYDGYSYDSIEDLTSSYATWVNSAKRGYKLTDGMRSLIIRDEIDIKEADSEFYSFLTTATDVEVNGNTATLTDGQRQMKFEFLSNQPLELSVMQCESLPTSPPIVAASGFSPKSNAGYRKLVLKGRVSGELNVTMKLTPLSESGNYTPIADVSLSDWTPDQHD